MSLISEADQGRLREDFARLKRPVRLLFFTQSIGCETCLQTRQIIDELPPLSGRISIEEVNFVLDKEKAAQYGIDRVPALALVGADSDSRIRFLGAPSGYEFISLVQAVLLVGGRGTSLTPENLARVASVDKPMTMKVFTTPT